MGVVESISLRGFPKQSDSVGGRTTVCFHYDSGQTIGGEIVRDDLAPPYETIIRLDDGRFVRGVECQYTPVLRAPADRATANRQEG